MTKGKKILICIICIAVVLAAGLAISNRDGNKARMTEDILIGNWVSTNLLWEETLIFTDNGDGDILVSGNRIPTGYATIKRDYTVRAICGEHILYNFEPLKSSEFGIILKYTDGTGLEKHYRKLDAAELERPKETPSLEEEFMDLTFDALQKKLVNGQWSDANTTAFIFSNNKLTAQKFDIQEQPYAITHIRYDASTDTYSFDFTVDGNVFSGKLVHSMLDEKEAYELTIKSSSLEQTAKHTGYIDTSSAPIGDEVVSPFF